MIHVAIPYNTSRRLPFYLAAEEWMARNLPADDYFFAWRVKPTVICGRHQEIDKEVNLEYCRDNDIDVVRRRSGGGAVFADMNNWMFSYITPGDAITTTFTRYTSMISKMLESLGLRATATGRNDILIDGGKVAGNAFYHIPGRSIVHGTMLLDIDAKHLSKALTPSRAKLESKGVKSVSSRVTSLHACGMTLDVDDFGKYAIDFLCDSEITLTPAQIQEIEQTEQRYYDPAFMKISPVARSAGQYSARVDGVGELTAYVSSDNDGRLTGVELTGDFFASEEDIARLGELLYGVSHEREAIMTRLQEAGIKMIIPGLSPATFANIITD